MTMFLVTNDDGINFRGIHVLAESLTSLGDVYVVAPNSDRSGNSHSITIHHPLRVERIEYKNFIKDNGRTFSVNGSPADCVKLGLDSILPRKPDWVISGINAGANLGNDTLYSGTVAAALEGVMKGCNSIAVSCVGQEDQEFYFETAARVVLAFLEKQEHFKEIVGCAYNINVPNLPWEDLRGIIPANLGRRKYSDVYLRRKDPRGKDYFWIGPLTSEYDEDIIHSDCAGIELGYATISALKPSLLSAQDNTKLFDIVPTVFKDKRK